MHTSASISVHQAAEGLPTLDLDGDINVCCSSQLHGEAIRLADSGQDVRVCCEHLEGLDASAVQIFVAMKDALASQGKSLHFDGLPEGPLELLRLAGVTDALGLASPPGGTATDRAVSERGELE